MTPIEKAFKQRASGPSGNESKSRLQLALQYIANDDGGTGRQPRTGPQRVCWGRIARGRAVAQTQQALIVVGATSNRTRGALLVESVA